MPVQCHDQFPFEIITSTGKTLISRIIINNIFVYRPIRSNDVHIDSKRRRSNNIIRRASSCENNDMELHNAASNGNLKRTHEAVCRKRELLWKMDSSTGNIPFHLAVINGHKEVASYLVMEYPQGSYTINYSKISPLYLAVRHFPQQYYLELIESMLHKLGRDDGLVSYLQQGKSIIREAIQNNNQEILKTIVKYGPDLMKHCDEEDLTPLSYAASNGLVNMVGFILERYLKSIKYQNKDKSYPIHKACLGGHIDILKMFYSKCPNSLLYEDQRGRTVMHLSAKQRCNKLKIVVNYLLTTKEGMFLLNKKDENGCTPLDLAISNGNNEVQIIIKTAINSFDTRP
ncbi:protein ACCELERATED CELL DEATH 6-like [Amaranthus tricolor]|uniref:protein ACCELERATED CELL DEATH 6-like n=1 Tax=Amaranthus tricolor TaxID=29722 RepID=UPI00258AE1C4|nr:protein ACCELERATED CELL DEATH 6-like [Amaranthus tricolor]